LKLEAIMTRLTNTTTETINLVVKGDAKNGVPPTASLKPGETREIDVVENGAYRGRVKMGSLVATAAPIERTTPPPVSISEKT
jgi:hypothetical protein